MRWRKQVGNVVLRASKAPTQHAEQLALRRRGQAEVKRLLAADGEPVVIFQMGKVGSTTVARSLAPYVDHDRFLKVHFLSDVSTQRNIHLRAGLYPFPYHLHVSSAVTPVLEELRAKPCKVVSLVRDPIARHVSGIFQVPEIAGLSSVTPARVLERLEEHLGDPSAFHYTFEWFDDQMRESFGIDVFASPFDRDRGAQRYQDDNVDLLVLRTEDVSTVGPEALASFLDLPDPVPIVSSNVRAEQDRADVYAEVLRTYRASEAALATAYESRFARHFYSDEMIEGFRTRWAKGDRHRR